MHGTHKLIVLFLFLSVGLVLRCFQFFAAIPQYHDGQEILLSATLHEDPDVSNIGQKFSVQDPYSQRIHISTMSFPQYKNGEVLRISGKIQRKEFEKGRVIYSMYYPRITVVAQDENVLFALARQIRDHANHVYSQTLPTVSSSLLMGIVFGAKEHYSEEFLSDLQATGVMHVIAASGMNVTFVAAALVYCLGFLLRRQIALAVAIAGIIFYVFIVGFQASIIRAAIMGSIVFGSQILGRQNFAGYAVLITAYMMVLWQPAYLVDVGFQLSFLATLGIMYLKPLIPLKETIYTEAITTTLAAEVATLPVLVGIFGKVGIFSLLVNALVLWTVPLLMILGSLAALFSFIAVPLAQLCLLLSLPFLLYFEIIVRTFGSFGIFQLPSLSWPFAAAYYLILLASVIELQRRERRSINP